MSEPLKISLTIQDSDGDAIFRSYNAIVAYSLNGFYVIEYYRGKDRHRDRFPIDRVISVSEVLVDLSRE